MIRIEINEETAKSLPILFTMVSIDWTMPLREELLGLLGKIGTFEVSEELYEILDRFKMAKPI